MSKEITTELVKELRESTGISIMQCKNALVEAEGDIEKALLVLKKKSGDIASKKAGRNAKEGLITTVSNNDKVVLLTLYCETDFVSKNDDFIKLAKELTDIALKDGFEKAKEVAIDKINLIIQKIGEKIELGNIVEIEGSTLGTYIHNGKNAIVVSLEGGDSELAKDIAMHITAMNPSYLSQDKIPAETKEQVKEMFSKEIKDINKPEDIKEKILNGKIDAYFKEQTLMDQIFIKDSNLTIKKLLSNSGATIKEFIKESIK
ncbi:MAG: translation elongation factor Ts [Patescibacteria group bacterium]|nr:translation elongation factor Ts [Patescibacteria group bacterium]